MSNIILNLDSWEHLPSQHSFNRIEGLIGANLPSDFKLFMSKYNNFIPKDAIAYCYNIKWKNEQKLTAQGIITEWFPIYSGKIEIDHGQDNPPSELPTLINALENYCDSDFPRVPPDTIPIAAAGDGDIILMGIGNINYGKIYYWVMDFEEEHDEPGISPTYDNVGFIANSFTEFLESLYPCEDN